MNFLRIVTNVHRPPNRALLRPVQLAALIGLLAVSSWSFARDSQLGSSMAADGAGVVCRSLVVPTSVPLIRSDTNFWEYRLAQGQLGGGGATDSALLQFYSADTGSFDLATGANGNLATCNQCVVLFQDVVGGIANKLFFQDRGVLNLTTAPGASLLPVALGNLRLVEVTIDPNTFHSTPVPGGDCFIGVSDRIFAGGFD